jgi:phosphoglycerate dehydrogenase-like enzyme
MINNRTKERRLVMIIYVDKFVSKNPFFIEMKQNFSEVIFVTEPNNEVEACFLSPFKVTKEFIDQLPNLKWIQLSTAGYNQIDLALLKERKITLTNAKDVYSITIAEDIITKMLVINRNVKKYIKQMHDKEWLPHQEEPEIYGSTIGFLGSGSLAVHANERLKAFQTKTLCYRQRPIKHEAFDETYFEEEGLETLLRESDYVINTLPLSKETYHLLDQKRLSLMKKSAVFINVGRGEVVDQDALIERLSKGLMRGAALDVMTPEPLPKESPLWEMDNVYITPHNAPSSPNMMYRLHSLLSDNLARYLNQKKLLNIIE